jgi:hypothetical protein
MLVGACIGSLDWLSLDYIHLDTTFMALYSF